MHKILPVIHHLDLTTTLQQAAIAKEVKCDGVFLISHNGKSNDLLPLAKTIKQQIGLDWVGINFLRNISYLEQCDLAVKHGFDSVWFDNMGVDSSGISDRAKEVADFISKHKLDIYCSVAFKYQPVEFNPEQSAKNARSLGFIPTTSGSATGRAPELEKIQSMSGERLAIASGLNYLNVATYMPYASDLLVATGISSDFHNFDFEKISSFVGSVRRSVIK